MIRVVLAAVLSSILAITTASAHEVEPAILDFEVVDSNLNIVLQWSIEEPVVGLDLSEIADTNEAEDFESFMQRREMDPADLAQELQAEWPNIQKKFSILADDELIQPELLGVSVPEVGDTFLARPSTVRLKAQLPPGATTLQLGWAPELGPLVIRQTGVETPYAGFLPNGGLSDPISISDGLDQTALQAFTSYISVGFDHIVPKGLDHILFVLGLFFLSLHLRPLLWQVTAFTLAHTVTLALGALDIIRISPDIVEPLIAASIVYVGIENLVARKLHPWRPIIVFCFGLLHGLGFASVLSDFGLGASHFVPKLIGFNVGVEIGQLAVIAAAFLTLAILFGGHDWWHRRIAAPVSVVIAVIAAFWVLERTGTIDPTGAWAPFSLVAEGGLPAFWTCVTALAIAAILTVATLMASTADSLRDTTGFTTSLVSFTAVVAAFTAGGWVFTAIIAAAWVLALRVQSLGGQD